MKTGLEQFSDISLRTMWVEIYVGRFFGLLRLSNFLFLSNLLDLSSSSEADSLRLRVSVVVSMSLKVDCAKESTKSLVLAIKYSSWSNSLEVVVFMKLEQINSSRSAEKCALIWPWLGFFFWSAPYIGELLIIYFIFDLQYFKSSSKSIFRRGSRQYNIW